MSMRPGLRTLLMAAVAGLSTFDPSLTLAVGPAVAVIVILTGHAMRLRITAPVVLAALFVAWVWASMSWTPTPGFTQATAILWAQLMVMFIAACDLIKRIAQLQVVAAGYVAGAVFTVVKSVYLGPDTSSVATGGRAILGNANVNYVAYALAAALALIVALWLTRTKTKLTAFLLGTATLIVVAGLVVSETRGAQLGGAFLLVWLLLCKVAKRPPLVLLLTVILAAAFCIVTGIADKASLAYESGSRVTGDWSGRLIIWPMAREVWAENPLVGIGGGAFIETNGLGIGAHNFILQTGTGLGFIGVALLMALIWSALSWKPGSACRQRVMLAGGFLVASSPAYLSGMWETAPASWMVLAVFARLGVLDVPSEIKTESGASNIDFDASTHNRISPSTQGLTSDD